MQIFQSIDEKSFNYNNRKYVKNFIVLKLGTTHIGVYGAYDSKIQLLGSTHYSEVKVDEIIYPNQQALMNVLSPLVFNKSSASSSANQNNTGLFFTNYQNLIQYPSNSINPTEIANRMNALASFLVSETQTPVMFQFTRNTIGIGDGNTVLKKYIFLFTGGKGAWGLNNNPVTATQFKLIYESNFTSDDISNDVNSVINALGEISDGNFVSTANTSTWDFFDSEKTYYFSYIKGGVLYFVAFVGTPGLYGLGNVPLTENDFTMATNSEVQPDIVPTAQQVYEKGSTVKLPANNFIQHMVGEGVQNRQAEMNVYSDADEASFNNYVVAQGRNITIGGGIDSDNVGNITIGFDGNSQYNKNIKMFENSLGIVITDNVSNLGLLGANYFGSNATDNTYIQKKYVDDAISNISGGTIPSAQQTFDVNSQVHVSNDYISLTSTSPAAGLAEMSITGNDDGTSWYLRGAFEGNESSIAYATDGVIRGVRIKDAIDNKGAVYDADYSANFTDRSLVDKEYVDMIAKQNLQSVLEIQPPKASINQTDDIDLVAIEFVDINNLITKIELTESRASIANYIEPGIGSFIEALGDGVTSFQTNQASIFDTNKSASVTTFAYSNIVGSGANVELSAKGDSGFNVGIGIDSQKGITIEDSFLNLGMKSFSDYSPNIILDDLAYTTTGAVKQLIDSKIGNVAPVSPTDTGIKGEIRLTTNYTYFCIETNTWTRVATDNTWV